MWTQKGESPLYIVINNYELIFFHYVLTNLPHGLYSVVKPSKVDGDVHILLFVSCF